MVLDAHYLGGGHIQLARGVLFNPSGCQLTLHLSRQIATICMLIKNFGPNHFVLIPPQGDPLSPERTAWAVS